MESDSRLEFVQSMILKIRTALMNDKNPLINAVSTDGDSMSFVPRDELYERLRKLENEEAAILGTGRSIARTIARTS